MCIYERKGSRFWPTLKLLLFVVVLIAVAVKTFGKINNKQADEFLQFNNLSIFL